MLASVVTVMELPCDICRLESKEVSNCLSLLCGCLPLAAKRTAISK